MSRPEKAENTSLEVILMTGINELEGDRDGGIEPKSFKVKLEADARRKNTTLAVEEMGILP